MLSKLHCKTTVVDCSIVSVMSNWDRDCQYCQYTVQRYAILSIHSTAVFNTVNTVNTQYSGMQYCQYCQYTVQRYAILSIHSTAVCNTVNTVNTQYSGMQYCQYCQYTIQRYAILSILSIHNTAVCNTLHEFYVVGQNTAILDRNMLPEHSIPCTPVMLDGNSLFRHCSQHSGVTNIKITCSDKLLSTSRCWLPIDRALSTVAQVTYPTVLHNGACCLCHCAVE
jgi:hypothetical protein